MNTPLTKPSLIGSNHYYEVLQGAPFSLALYETFYPQDGSLHFRLIDNKLGWLHIDSGKGILYGIAPTLTHDKTFQVTIAANNTEGTVSSSFTLKVKTTDVVETMPGSLELILSLRQEEYGLSHLHPYTPSLLEYVFVYFNLPQFREKFLKSLHEAAKQQHLTLAEPIEAKDFINLLKTINKDAEKILLEKYLIEHEQDKILTIERLNHWQLRNLFLQGSQPQGVHAIPVWNHWGYPDLHNWTDGGIISNVLDSAADALRRIKSLNQQETEHLNLKPK
jgi:hypothetical protein